jgi:predicted alpha/beta-hydrolase family hydrolase
MSKALYGHLGGPDAALLAEVARLRRRVGELEEQVAAYEAAARVEIVELHDADLDAAWEKLGTQEPALT